MNVFQYCRRFFILLCNLAIVCFSLVTAFTLRFDLSVPHGQEPNIIAGLAVCALVKVPIFWLARVHRGWWHFLGITHLIRIFFANVAGSVVFTAVVLLVLGPAFPRSVYLIDFLVCLFVCSAVRLAVWAYREIMMSHNPKRGAKGILIYGAGAAGVALARELHTNPAQGYHVIGFLDDDHEKRNLRIIGIPVLGSGREAAAIVDRYRGRKRCIEEVIIAMPSAKAREMLEALANCRAAGVACKTIPSLCELLNDKVLSSQIRNVSVQDLLGRKPVQLNAERIHLSITGRSVLVTGGSGSIGSELCRQIARLNPRVLVVLDQAESELFKLERDLRASFPSIHMVPSIGDIRDAATMNDIIRCHHVDSLFHSAAYKHVPLMEAHVLEAVRNNVLGTWNVIESARYNGVADFLMISSDKAVNPSSIMGLTKRVAELIVTARRENGGARGTKCVAVRFGNVLASSGSVIPIFQEQIAAGGPVTVTHPDMRRYFMTIPEAVQLVLQTSTMGQGSEIFVLDMGEPVRILDLARHMIRLSGRIPEEEVEIRYVGPRPGEKLYEELKLEAEDMQPTFHDKIRIFRGSQMDYAVIQIWISELQQLLASRNEPAVLAHLKKLVPEYNGAAQSAHEQERGMFASA
jgi:FlaA1/EpsC-like NDP-sugar epimerase